MTEELTKKSKPKVKSPKPAPKLQSTTRKAQFEPTGVDENEAWAIMESEGIVTVSALVKRLRVDGKVISEDRLRKKLIRVPGYYAKYVAPKKVDEEVKIALDVAERLAAMAEGATSKTMHGLYMVLMKRLGELVPVMTPEQADGMVRLFSLGQQITGLMHDLRGHEIGRNLSATAPVAPLTGPAAPFRVIRNNE